MEDGGLFVALVVGAVLCGVIGAIIAASRGRALAGLFSGLLLGPLGWIIAALLTPSAHVQAERDRRLAAEIAKATGGFDGGHRQQAQPQEAESIRREAVAEAVRRDPTLLSASTTEELARLREQAEAIEIELRLRNDLNVVKSRQAEEAERRRSEELRQERERQAAEQQIAAAQETRRRAAEDAERLRVVKAQREANAQTMAPLHRVLYLHKKAAIWSGAAAAAALVLVLALIVQSSARSDEDARLASARASASASASSTSASAASASVAASRASVESEASASAKAAQDAAAVAARRPACLKGARGSLKNLSRCDLSKADLSNLDLSGRDLTSAILSDANLKGAIFDGAKLTFVEWGNARCPDGTFANNNGGNCYENLLEPGDKLRPLKIGQSARVADFTVTLTSFEANASTNARVQRDGEWEPQPGNVYALIGARIRNNNTEVEYLNGELKAAINGEDGYCGIDGGTDSLELRKGQVVNSRLCLQAPVKSVRRGVIQINVGYDFLDNPPLYWEIP